MLDHFDNANLDKLVYKLLGDRRFEAKYSCSNIFKTLLETYATNGSCIEDSKRIPSRIPENSQGYRLCGLDVFLYSFRGISIKSSSSRSESGIEYKLNNNPDCLQQQL